MLTELDIKRNVVSLSVIEPFFNIYYKKKGKKHFALDYYLL